MMIIRRSKILRSSESVLNADEWIDEKTFLLSSFFLDLSFKLLFSQITFVGLRFHDMILIEHKFLEMWLKVKRVVKRILNTEMVNSIRKC